MDNVIVTGASRGLGLAIAERLAGEGFRVVAVARRSSEALERASANAAAGALTFAALDLADVAAIPAFVRETRARLGPIYGLVNNAGLGTEGLLANMPDADIEALIRLNTLSPILMSKYVVRGMMAEGRGRVINISSIIASTGFNALSVYAATKASLVGFTRSLAREVGRVGVTVNAIAPGFIDTELTKGLGEAGRERVAARSALRRLADPRDVAAMAAFLMGEGGRNITGAVMTVDAGRRRRAHASSTPSPARGRVAEPYCLSSSSYLNETFSFTRYCSSLPFLISMSCSTTSATRNSRNVLAARSTALLAARSQD